MLTVHYFIEVLQTCFFFQSEFGFGKVGEVFVGVLNSFVGVY